ncbi:3-dehydroquinate synthase [Salinicola avicenniae]|uniref:3-dehydroquinate synthase n=1 Tax=Salinicola avicenniae TaxID=2916836 RepID=UPI002072DB20|nr:MULTISPECIES: 3-dehydroquinate synthase [unclassified Salinicola]
MNRPAVSFSIDGDAAIEARATSSPRAADRGSAPHVPQADIHWQHFSVPFDYPVAFTREVFSPDNPLLAELVSRRDPNGSHRCLVYVDAGVASTWPDLDVRVAQYFAAHADRLTLLHPPITVAGGETLKNQLDGLRGVLEDIRRHGVDRHAFVLAIGGGAMLDAVGLATAIGHRGIRLIRLPTTVLSQNDSGVGVKNAVNFQGTKNFVGTFAPPWAVLNDFDFLDTLSRRDRLAGISEAIKVALIRDGDFFDWLESHADQLAVFDPRAEETMIRRSAALHMRQIAHGGDPFELGSSRPLDYGHWAAHKLEALTHHAVGHGDAVAIGIALDARYSVLAGLLPAGAEWRVVWLLQRLGLPTFHEQLLEIGHDGHPAILEGLREFREHLGGELTITLLGGLGRGTDVHDIDEPLMLEAIHWLREEVQGHAAA